MQRSSVLSSLTAVALVFGLAACSADAITNALQDQVSAAQEQADIGTVAAGSAMENLDLMYDGSDGAMGSMMPSNTPGLRFDVRSSGPLASISPPASSCTYDGTRHNCDPVDFANGLVLTASYELFSGNQPQETFGTPAATDSINMDAVLQGTVENTDATATIDRHLNLTVAQDPAWDQQRIWHGQGTDTSSATVNGTNTTRSYTLNTTTTFNDIVVPQPRTYPASGNILATIDGTRTREGDRTVSKSVSYAVRVTFNGGRIVPLDIGPTSDNFTGHFCIDLQTRSLASTGCQPQ
jgi:hypothetical protein